MYVPMTDMLARANKGHYAVMAINCLNLESVYATIKAAEAEDAPIIIDLLEEHMEKHVPREYVLPPAIQMAKDAQVDVAINLDHGKNFDYVVASIEAGFSSVMIDQSELGFRENIRKTREIVELASHKNVSVEAEVGNMGAVKGDHLTQADMYTNPDDAIRFIKRTNVTALAISFGSSHGVMPKDFVPVFDFEIVEKIKSATNLPLVLHGGSGCGADNIRKAVAAGINKVNVGSDVMKAQADAIYQQQQIDRDTEYVDLLQKTIPAAEEVVRAYIKIVGSNGQNPSTM